MAQDKQKKEETKQNPDTTEPRAVTPVGRLKAAINMPSVQEQFKNALQDSAPLFAASLIDVYSSDTYLQQCEPRAVIMEALKAATLRLPINKNLGFAWIIPRWSSKESRYVPGFQMGWKGIVQLAQRTGQYRYINCGEVCEGELRKADKLTGEIDIYGEKTSDKIVGYFAYIELISGFKKASFWPKDQVEAHAIKYNPECKKAKKLAGNWLENFDSRAKSTVLKHLISKYGIMTVEMADAMARDEDYEGSVQHEINVNANQDIIDITAEPVDQSTEENSQEEMSEEEKDRSRQMDLEEANKEQQGRKPNF